MWATGYPKVASDAPGLVPSYDEAVEIAAALFDPVLNGTSRGDWEPEASNWRSGEPE